MNRKDTDLLLLHYRNMPTNWLVNLLNASLLIHYSFSTHNQTITTEFARSNKLCNLILENTTFVLVYITSVPSRARTVDTTVRQTRTRNVGLQPVLMQLSLPSQGVACR
jgi:hypothetical protein